MTVITAWSSDDSYIISRMSSRKMFSPIKLVNTGSSNSYKGFHQTDLIPVYRAVNLFGRNSIETGFFVVFPVIKLLISSSSISINNINFAKGSGRDKDLNSHLVSPYKY